MLKLIIITSLFFLSCSESKSPSGSDLIDEEALDGSISGAISREGNLPASGVQVTASPGGYTTVSDSLGLYTIPKMEAGVYDLTFGGFGWRDSTLSDVSLLEDQDLLNINMVLVANLEEIIDSIATQERDVVGFVEGSDSLLASIQKVTIEAYTGEGVLIWTQEASLRNNNTNFSTTMTVPAESGYLNVLVSNGSDKVIGYETTTFDQGISEINFPKFSADNALPTFTQSFEREIVKLGETNTLSINVQDLYGDVSSVTIKVNWNNLGWNEAPGGIFTTSITQDTTEYLVEIIDSDSNSVLQSFQYIRNEFTDARDSTVYQYTEVGPQIWMSENLRYLPTDSEGVRCWEDDDESCSVMGVFYLWSIAMDGVAATDSNPSGVRGICPEGWHVPSRDEWLDLLAFLVNTEGLTVEDAYESLRSPDTWTGSTGGTDMYDMNIHARGYIIDNGSGVQHIDITTEASFISTTSKFEDTFLPKRFFPIQSTINLEGTSLTVNYFYSLRCVFDDLSV